MCIHIIAGDFGLRNALTFLLAQHGFAVAPHASAAEFWAEGEPKPFHAVILDLDLPGQEGKELIAWLQTLPRAPRVIALTSKTQQAIHRQLCGLAWPILLQKPFIADELLQLI